MSVSRLLTTSPAKASVTKRAADGVVRAVKRVLSIWAARRDVRYLATLDERALKDIGLTSTDVEGALARPWFSDPTALLVVRACERRAIARDRARAGHRRLALTDADEGADRREAPAPGKPMLVPCS